MADTTSDIGVLWDRFEAGLGAYLATMADPDEQDHLLIELPDTAPEEQGCAPYAQFATFDSGLMIRAEISGNAYLQPKYALDPAAQAFLERAGWSGNIADSEGEANWYLELPRALSDDIAHDVTAALRSLFGVAHPHLLTYSAWGPAADGAEVLGLCAAADVPVDAPAAPALAAALVVEPEDREQLTAYVARVLTEKYDEPPTLDDDGDFVLHHLDQILWVRVRRDQPAVEIMARVAHGVHSRRATAVELGLLNRDHIWVHWVLRDRAVWQHLFVPAMPFVPRHLDGLLDVFFAAMTETRDDLAYRTGAKVA